MPRVHDNYLRLCCRTIGAVHFCTFSTTNPSTLHTFKKQRHIIYSFSWLSQVIYVCMLHAKFRRIWNWRILYVTGGERVNKKPKLVVIATVYCLQQDQPAQCQNLVVSINSESCDNSGAATSCLFFPSKWSVSAPSLLLLFMSRLLTGRRFFFGFLCASST
jgi:hypothetical protein